MASRGIAPLILNLSTRYICVVNFTPWPLYLREVNPVTHRTGGWVGHRASLDDFETRKISWPCWDMNPSLSTLHRQHSAASVGHALYTSDVGAVLHGMTERALDFNDLA